MSNKYHNRLFGNYIKIAREKYGYSQLELARVVNVDKRSIERIETGDSEPLNSTITKLVVALDLTDIYQFRQELYQFLKNQSLD